MPDPRVTRLARLLVDYSTHIQPNDKVAILGQPAVAPLIEAIYERVLERGAYPHLMLNLPGLDEIWLRKANEAQLEYFSPFQRMVINSFDATINIDGSPNTRELSGIEPARQTTRRRAYAPLLATYMERGAVGALKWVRAAFPSTGYAQDADMSLRDYETFVFSACHTEDDDDPIAFWQSAQAEQQRLVDWLKPRDRVIVRGPNVDLTLSIKGRTFLNSCGTHNMPDGEIYTGPVEDSVNGWVRFTYPVVVNGVEVDGIEIQFENGKATHATARKNQAYLISTLDTDAGSRYLGEFAVGTNFGVKRFTKNILFDEKIGGTIHMAFGKGYPETGSKNDSALHWDMICDMRDGSEIWVDGELMYQGGQFKI
jgi:aminopeptidase